MTADTPYVPIDCGLYDYLEIACMHRYEVILELRDGSSVRGNAVTTETRANAEFLLLRRHDQVIWVRLDEIVLLLVTTRPCSFEEVLFG